MHINKDKYWAEDEAEDKRQNKRLAQFFVDDYDYLAGMLDCMIEVSKGEHQAELRRIKDDLKAGVDGLQEMLKNTNRKQNNREGSI